MLMTRRSSNSQLTSMLLSILLLQLLLGINVTVATFNYSYEFYNCEDPGIPENGYSMEGSDNYTLDATVQFGCDYDHILYGTNSITCTRGMYKAYWSDHVPVCIPAAEETTKTGRTRSSRCGKPPSTGPSHHTTTLPSSNNTIIEYECHDKEKHVEVSGDRLVYCYKKEWCGEPLQCRRKVSCPQQNPNQYIEYKQSGTLEGDITLFACSKGYTLIGASHVTCLSTEEWSSEWPSCESVSCPYPTGVPYGQVRLNTNTEAEYRCYNGYNLIGSNKVWCTGTTGTWTPGVPDCQPVDCGVPNDLSNGYIQYSATTFNHRAYYHCNNGYNRVGSFSRRCASNGVWSEEEPICQSETTIATIIVECDPLTDPVGGKVILPTPSIVNSVATYNCDRGRTRFGSATRTCQADRTWSGEEPECITAVTDCGEPVSITNGDVSYPSTIIDSLATYSCNDGYTLVGGDATVKCNDNGDWEGSLPACAAIDCGHPPSIQNGQATFSSTNFKSVATYTCNKGHSLNGDSKSIICQANGQWQEALTTCVEINCNDPPVVSNGIPDYNSTLFLSEVTYTCKSGYIYTGGSPSLICQANSKWFGEQPTCEAVDCGEPVSITNGDVSYPSTIIDSLATYSCNDGYTLVGDDATVKCNENGEWEGLLPACVVDCGLLDLPNNTIISYPNDNTLIGSTANYSCQPGYVLSIDSIRTCSENGTWTEPEPACQPIDCGTLPQPNNGVIRPPVSTTLASFVRYSCNNGFTINGIDIRVCLMNGSWSGTPPTCQIIDCGDLSNPENGRVDYNATTFTSIAEYTCDNGFMLVPVEANKQRFCRIDGKWGGVEPTCELIDCGELTPPANGGVDVTSTLLGGMATYMCNNGYNINEAGIRTCGDNGNWSGNEPSCQIVDCGDPGVLIDGQETYFGTSYRQVATFICNDDFTMVGDGARRCEADGEWTGEIPTCVATVPTCGIPESPQKGYAILRSTIPGSVVEYGCIEGYEVIGTKTRTCGTDEVWSGDVPSCKRITRCPVLETPAFSRRVGESNEIGSVIYYICEDDYDTVGDNARLCQENRKWSGIQPICVLRNSSCSDSGVVNDSVGRLCECVDGELTDCYRYRQDWLTLSTIQKNQYTQAVLEASSNELYKPFYQSLMQLYEDGSGTLALSFVPTDTQFLPWHRYFLQQYEDLLRLIDPSVSLPFWDWTLLPSNPYINPVFSPKTGFGNSSDSDNCVQDGPFRRDEFFLTQVSTGDCLERLYQQGFLLSRDQLNDLILVKNSDEFSVFFKLLTVPYVSIRCAVGGTMCALNIAVPPEDPLHILVLTFLDSIWDRWQQKSSEHLLAGYGSDNTPLVLTNDAVTAMDYHDNSNLPHGLSVRYGTPVDAVGGTSTMEKRSVQELQCLSEDAMNKLSLSDQDRNTIRAACRLFYTYLTH